MFPSGELPERHFIVCTLLSQGLRPIKISAKLGLSRRSVKIYLNETYRILQLDRERDQRVLLAIWWNCELFQVGMTELGLVRL